MAAQKIAFVNDPVGAAGPNVAGFTIHLFEEKGLSVKIMECYCSAIAVTPPYGLGVRSRPRRLSVSPYSQLSPGETKNI